MSRPHLLILHPSPVPPPLDPAENVYALLSKEFSGAVITTKWRNRDEDQSVEALAQRALALGKFTYHPIPVPRLFRPVKFVYYLLAFVFLGCYLHFKKRRFDAVVAYGPYTTALAGYIIRRLLGVRFIMDIPGDPFAGLLVSRATPRRLDQLKIKLGRIMVPALLNRADHLKLLYPGQLSNLIRENDRSVSYFADFTSVSNIESEESKQNYLLFVGHPWYLKGVDLLIPAFLSIADNFPDTTLRLVGWCPNRNEFERQAAGDLRVEFYDPLPHPIVKEWMSRCKVFVLASRTEGTPRVLLEAMAAKAAIVASRVGGIPNLIEDEKSGLLFEPGNRDDLMRQMRRILSDETLRQSLAQSAYETLQANYLERHYLDNYVKMIDSVITPVSSCGIDPVFA